MFDLLRWGVEIQAGEKFKNLKQKMWDAKTKNFCSTSSLNLYEKLLVEVTYRSHLLFQKPLWGLLEGTDQPDLHWAHCRRGRPVTYSRTSSNMTWPLERRRTRLPKRHTHRVRTEERSKHRVERPFHFGDSNWNQSGLGCIVVFRLEIPKRYLKIKKNGN